MRENVAVSILIFISQSKICKFANGYGGGADNSSFTDLFDQTNLSAASAGSLFVFFGNRKAVLISNNQIMKN